MHSSPALVPVTRPGRQLTGDETAGEIRSEETSSHRGDSSSHPASTQVRWMEGEST